MSFISAIASQDFITVVSDGQVTYEGKVIKEDYKKFRKINNDQFIAYAGAKEICEKFAEHLKFSASQRYDLKLVAEDLFSTIKSITPYERFKTSFIIGGISENNEIEFYTLSNNPLEEKVKSYLSHGDGVSYGFLSNEENEDKINLENTLISHLSKTGFNTPNKCIRAQKMLNADVEKIDPTVNRRTFELIIRK